MGPLQTIKVVPTGATSGCHTQPLDPTDTQLLFRFIAAAYERRSLGLATHHPFENWGRFLPEQTTAAALLDRLLHHAVILTTHGESFRMKEAKTRSMRTTKKSPDQFSEVGTFVGHQRGLRDGR